MSEVEALEKVQLVEKDLKGKHFFQISSSSEFKVVKVDVQKYVQRRAERNGIFISLQQVFPEKQNMRVEEFENFNDKYDQMTYALKLRVLDTEAWNAFGEYKKSESERKRLNLNIGLFQKEVYVDRTEEFYRYWQSIVAARSNLITQVKQQRISLTEMWLKHE